MAVNLSDAAERLSARRTLELARQLDQLQAAGEDVIRFDIGEPDDATPPHITEAAVAALRKGETGYFGDNVAGDFVSAVQRATVRESGFRPQPEQIVAAPAVSFIYTVIRCVANPGDEVIIPSPAYPAYQSVCRFQGVTAVTVPLREDRAFTIDPDDVARAITPRTRLLVINFPHNPTGAALPAPQLEAIGRLCRQHRLLILSDETYAQLSYDGAVVSAGVLDGCREQVVVVRSLSKAYAMTGWRVGWGVGPAAVMGKVNLLIQSIITAQPPFLLRGAVAALDSPPEQLARTVAEYRWRRDAVAEGLRRLPGVRCGTPGGALYLFPNITGTGMRSDEFAAFALQRARVAVLPGTVFGQHGEGYVRLCYAAIRERCREGMARLTRAFADRPSGAVR